MSELSVVVLIATILWASMVAGCSGTPCDLAGWRGRHETALGVVRAQPSVVRTDVLVLPALLGPPDFVGPPGALLAALRVEQDPERRMEHLYEDYWAALHSGETQSVGSYPDLAKWMETEFAETTVYLYDTSLHVRVPRRLWPPSFFCVSLPYASFAYIAGLRNQGIVAASVLYHSGQLLREEQSRR